MLAERLAELLNAEQLEAVTAPRGPLLVVAGAGTGKTRVITYRVAHMVASGTPPYRVLAVTFTNKAAREMKSRIQNEIECGDAWVSTFHSFAARVLRRDAAHLGFTPDFSIYDEDDSKSVTRAALLETANTAAEVELSPQSVAAEISRLKTAGVSPDETRVHDLRSRIVRDCYAFYAKALQDNNAMDFDDLLLNLLRLLDGESEAREYWRGRFAAVLVDEYQDTNEIQARIVDALAEKHGNITVTGDPDQSIYSWRGARLKNILEFGQKYPGAKVVRLESNYRSTPDIVGAADALIKNNAGRLERSLRSIAGPGRPVTVALLDDDFAEARWVVERVKTLAMRGGYTYGDFAVLYRTNYQSRPFETICLDYEVPYVVVGGMAFFERQEVRDVIAYLRLALNPADEAAFRRAAVRPSRGVGAKTLDAVVAHARARSLDVLSAAAELVAARRLSSGQAAGLHEFVEIMQRLRSLPLAPVHNLVKAVVEGAGFRLYWDERQETERVENVDELLNAAAQFDEDNPESSLRLFLDMVALVTDQDRMAGEKTQGCLTLMTLHAAKGLEFPVVFLAGLAEGCLPHSRSLADEDNPDALEEERRLCYVGITRARRELFLASPAARRFGGAMVKVAASRFINELPERDIHYEDERRLYGAAAGASFWSGAETRRFGNTWGGLAAGRSAASGGKRRKPAAARAADAEREAVERVYDAQYSLETGFRKGDRVRHSVFGDGVVERAGSEHVVVDFQRVGRKRLAVSFAKLEKIG
ncbi:MAG TPA: ATP-dependent DNA helicase PcrA [Planctomycetes bacterium]|nr:ATP-dependent DNA helicase PcrA [Planctomycetota bacterium]